MQILLLLILGAAVGLVATKLMKVETDLVTTVAVGVLGSVVGVVAIRLLLVLSGWLAVFVGAVAGAALLIWLWQHFVAKR